MTAITIDRAVVEQALHVAESAGYPVALIKALRAALAQQAEPVQEPVAWNWMLDGLPYGRACYGDPPDADIAERAATAGRSVRLLYTAPPQRKPLPKHDQHCVDVPGYGLTAVRLVRAVERAHGIKE